MKRLLLIVLLCLAAAIPAPATVTTGPVGHVYQPVAGHQVAVREKTVVAVGDSLTKGFGVAANLDYPKQLGTLLGSAWTVVNFGVNSATCDDLAATAAAQIDVYNVSWRTVTVAVWCGTNNVYFGATAAVAYQSYVDYCTARRAAGAFVISMTMLPRTGGEPVDFETSRQTFNTLVRANHASFSDAFYDAAGDTNIGDSGDQNDTTYYQADKTHLNATGEAIIAAGVQTALASVPVGALDRERQQAYWAMQRWLAKTIRTAEEVR